MTDPLFLDDDDLAAYGLIGDDTADRAKYLLAQQRDMWPAMKTGTGHLATVRTRELRFDGFSMKLQFNPGRIVSSSASVDQKSISKRPCFLCRENLPADQKALAIGDYLILGNPFPIFPEHFTIPHRQHIPQRIEGAVGPMLKISKCMGKHYTLFYNGPKCGASAPDHLHFQAGTYGFMPIDTTRDAQIRHFRHTLSETGSIRVTAVDDGLRRYIELESAKAAAIESAFEAIYAVFQSVTEQPGEEPMLNILSSCRKNIWTVTVFLRRKHRPAQYFLEGDERILFSPASVDFGGVCIMPLEKDFLRLTPGLLRDMFEQVSVSANDFKHITQQLSTLFNTSG